MGFSVTRFTETVDQNLLCSICSCVLEDAVLTPCGHSFCQLCLQTWIQAREVGPPTCPECRGRLGSDQPLPILSVRNLINGLEIFCQYKHRGCRVVTKLEYQAAHKETCGFSPIECAGCGLVVNRCELAEHHMRCAAIAAALRDEEDLLHAAASGSLFSAVNSAGGLSSEAGAASVFHLGLTVHTPRLSQSRGNIRPGRHSSRIGSPLELAELNCRVAGLELQLKRMKRDLESAESKNKKLELELKRAREELDKTEIHSSRITPYVEFDPDYEYGFTAASVPRLSSLICRFLQRKPGYICRESVFNALKRCYENFSRTEDQYEHNVHMLLATANASNWFTEAQRLQLHLWLQALSRRRQFQHISQNVRRQTAIITSTP